MIEIVTRVFLVQEHHLDNGSLTDMDSALGTNSPSLELDSKSGNRNNRSEHGPSELQ